MKNTIILGALGIILIGGTIWFSTANQSSSVMQDDQSTTTQEDMRVANPEGETETPSSKLKAETFTGTLQDVNEGCYVDGECYAVVDGKHITIILGWRQEVVGQVLEAGGANSSVADLKAHIGKKVEVYAQKKDENTYTLYGSAGFYVEMQ